MYTVEQKRRCEREELEDISGRKGRWLPRLTVRGSSAQEPGEISASSNHLATAFRLIKEMQKKFRTEEAEEREKEGAVKQDKLVLSIAKANPKLKDL